MSRVSKMGVRVRRNLDKSPSGVILSTNPGHADKRAKLEYLKNGATESAILPTTPLDRDT